MTITLERLHRFVRDHGRVDVQDTTGNTGTLKEGEPDVWELAQNANRFRWEGSWHDREDFEKILDARLSSGNLDEDAQ